MSAAAAISLDRVGKRFRLRAAGAKSLKAAAVELLTLRHRRRGGELWALRDVSFEVGRGETLGIIGANGAGKSTLLALLAGTKIPTEGRIRTRGAISSLLELGAGFHPELTGRENVFLSGAILGLSRAQMARRFDSIVEFAGLADFIDQPVKHYSSGMYVRLGFAVAVEVDPDILLIDEVLAVGDVAFQRRCLRRIDDFRAAGKTMLIISHDLRTIQSVSDRILFLEQGRVQGIGDPTAVVGNYESRAREQAASGLQREWGTGEVRITDVRFEGGEEGGGATAIRPGAALTARVAYACRAPVTEPVFGFAVADRDGRVVHGSNTQIAHFATGRIEGRGELLLRLPAVRLAPGDYLFSFSVHSADHQLNYHRLDHAFPLTVEGDRRIEGCVDLESRWEAPA